jgi:hypothetical protein
MQDCACTLLNFNQLAEMGRKPGLVSKVAAEIKQFFFGYDSGKAGDDDASFRINTVLNRHAATPRVPSSYTHSCSGFVTI